MLFLIVLGFVILALVFSDVLVTTLTVRGGGFLTNRFSSLLWQIGLLIHQRNSNHRLLAGLGLWLLSGMVVLWYLLTWLGWWLIFSSYADAVVNASNKQPASIWGRVYFTVYTITTLGRGDYQPGGTFWHLLTGLASISGFFLVTLSIAYLFPVVSALTQKRALAVYIASLGGTGDEILARAWNGKDFGQLYQHLINLASLLSEMGEKHLTYPILHYFHSNERSRSFPLSFVALDEAMTLLQYGVAPDYRPDGAALDPARRASAAFLRTLTSAYLEPSKKEPPLPSLELLRKHGIPTVSDREFIYQTSCVNKRRRLLLAFVSNDGWLWDAVASCQTTSRASNLDDQTAIDEIILH